MFHLKRSDVLLYMMHSDQIIMELGGIQKLYFFKNKNIFHHLKLEIAPAIPVSNDEKCS